MHWKTKSLRTLGACALLLVAAACSQVQYRAEGASPQDSSKLFDRTVNYRVARAFYDDPPRCAFVLPTQGPKAQVGRARIVETALARQLSHRLERVIGPDRRDRLSRRLAIDPSTSSGRKRFAAVTKCAGAVEVSTKGMETTFVVVWAQARLEMAARLIRASDGTELWRGHHSASRSEGSFPLSPVSLPMGAFSASRFHGDNDVLPSMADDVARRIVASLPDTRGLFRAQ